MNEKIPVRQVSLADQVLEILIERIVNGVYPPGSKLPPENELREEFNVSRSTIRTAVSRLEDRKLVHRQRGVGTFVSSQPNISNPLNEFIEFPQLIRENGYEPGYQELSAEILEAGEEIRELLQLEPESQILKIRKIFTANDDAIIYVINHIPLWVFKDILTPAEAVQPGVTENFIEFFEDRCHQKISHFISTVKAEILKNIAAPPSLKNDGPYTPVLVIKEIGYNGSGKPIVSSNEFHPDDWMTFKMMRRRGKV
jgi:GntR family transcriptional regulator